MGTHIQREKRWIQKPRMMLVLKLKYIQLALFLLSSFSLALGQAEDDQGNSIKFPSIWVDGQDGGGNDEAAYRIRAEVQLSDSSKSFIIEEWASGLLEKFRLDVIETAGKRRRTYMTFKMTNESFYYEPFKCKLVEDNFSSVLYKELADMLQPAEMSSQFIPIGVGALWIHALKLESSNSQPSQDSAVDCTTGDAANVLNCFESFAVHATGGYPYDLIFYFRANRTGPESLASIVLRQPNKPGPLMRIKILEYESALLNVLQESPDLFDLPTGYGCKRSDKMEEALDTPVNIMGPDLIAPSVFRLDIVAQLPGNAENADDHNQWRSHSTSVRLVAGRLTLGLERQRDYLILERRELVPDKRLSGRRATLRRGRQVWDLGTGGPEALGSPNKRGRKIFYELDDQLGKCLAFGESQLEIGASIDFFPTLADESSGSYLSELPEVHASVPKGLMLDVEFLNTIFGNHSSLDSGYHLIRKGVSGSRLNLHELIFEKRLDRFDMRNQHGNLIWSGPVSLVRKDLQSRKLAWHAGPWGNDLPESSVTIHFLSPEVDRIVGKINLALNERRTLDQLAFHRELNVEPCLSQDQTSGQHLEIQVNYPLDSESVADKLANCGHCRTMVQEQFLRALNNVSIGQLDPLLVDGIDLEVVGYDLLKVRAKLMVRPNLLNYRREPGEMRFSSARKSLLFNELQPNESGCADSCAHYNCSAFAYCPKTSQCDIFMGKPEILSKIGTQPAAGCSLFRNLEGTDDDLMQHPRAPEPIEMVQQLREAIVKTEKEGNNPLGLWLTTCEHGHTTELARLVPISLETSRDAEDGETSSHLLRSEYELVLENRRLKEGKQPASASMFPLPEVKYMAYEECRALCDQTDCKSFSHCQLDRTCQISLLHDTEMLREHSERDDYCFVFARDSLSKFNKPLLQVALPPDTGKRGKPSMKPLKVGESRDCASSCMNEIGFKCRSFYHCPQQQQLSDSSDSTNANCYLSRRYPQAIEILAAQASLDSNDSQTISCQLYTRSHLADFDRFYGRALPEAEVDDTEESSQIVKRSLNAEACGLECALGNCQAFHVCRQQHEPEAQTGSGSTQRSLEPVCVLLSTKANASDTEWLRPDKLVANELCTSFIVAQQSELRQALGDPGSSKQTPWLNDDDDGSDCEHDPDPATTTTRKTGGGGNWWLLNVLFVLVGLAIGHGVSLVWRQRRR